MKTKKLRKLEARLRPCPFCGQPAEWSEMYDCPRCGNLDCLVDAHATIGGTETKIRAWNTRPLEDAHETV